MNNNKEEEASTRRSLEYRDLTWARVKYQATLKHRRIREVVDDLLTHALSEWEGRGKL